MHSSPIIHPCPFKNLLITGPPGIGKTTLIMKLAHALRPYQPVGFYTREIRVEGVRKGFELVSLDGNKGVLSHVDIQSSHRIGKYGVDIPEFERFLQDIPFFVPDRRVIVIDEIGKMECISQMFMDMLIRLLDGNRPVVATIALKRGGVLDRVKQRSDVHLFHVLRLDRDMIINDVRKALEGLLPTESAAGKSRSC